MLVLLAVVIVVSLQAVGVALVLAMLVTPAATATLITRRLIWVMILAAVIGAGSSLAGLYLSYYLNLASGPAIVLAATAVFGVVYAVVGRRDRTSGMIVRSPASDG
jgi:ABC-type Mn2+/Zn2+ transport system permease subunit